MDVNVEKRSELSNRQKWQRTALVTLLVAPWFELGFSIPTKLLSGIQPYPFHVVWILLYVWLVYLISKRMLILSSTGMGVFGISVVLGTLLLLIPVSFFAPANYSTIGMPAPYTAISEFKPGYINNSEGGEMGMAENPLDVYPIESKIAKRHSPFSVDRVVLPPVWHDYGVGKSNLRAKGYWFWQASWIKGYFNPERGGFHGPSISLYFTVGPAVVLDAFVKGALFYFPWLFLAQYLYYLFTREWYWFTSELDTPDY